MKPISFIPVGHIENEFDEPVQHHLIKSKTSRIVLDKKYLPALQKIELCTYIDIVFHFHASDEYQLVGKTHTGEERGIFASRSPKRPNGIGVTTVKLLELHDNILVVEGLDAIDQTPVLDIKCCDTSWFEKESNDNPVHNQMLKADPRLEVHNLIETGDIQHLLLRAGALHGHFCPGLAMGVMAATHAMRQIREWSDGMEDLVAITETNNCFSDGIQYVTGCTFGNNALIFHDLGKTAFTLTNRSGKGLRVITSNDSRELLIREHPKFFEYMQTVVIKQNHDPELRVRFREYGIEASFGILKLGFDKIFEVQEVSVELPRYAPIHESIVCTACGEQTMASRSIEKERNAFCLACAGVPYGKLTGHGIVQE